MSRIDFKDEGYLKIDGHALEEQEGKVVCLEELIERAVRNKANRDFSAELEDLKDSLRDEDRLHCIKVLVETKSIDFDDFGVKRLITGILEDLLMSNDSAVLRKTFGLMRIMLDTSSGTFSIICDVIHLLDDFTDFSPEFLEFCIAFMAQGGIICAHQNIKGFLAFLTDLLEHKNHSLVFRYLSFLPESDLKEFPSNFLSRAIEYIVSRFETLINDDSAAIARFISKSTFIFSSESEETKTVIAYYLSCGLSHAQNSEIVSDALLHLLSSFPNLIDFLVTETSTVSTLNRLIRKKETRLHLNLLILMCQSSSICSTTLIELNILPYIGSHSQSFINKAQFITLGLSIIKWPAVYATNTPLPQSFVDLINDALLLEADDQLECLINDARPALSAYKIL